MSLESDQLAAITAAIAEGVSEVSFRGRTVKYRSLQEMLKVQEILQKKVSGTNGPDTLQVEFSKGYS
jgi:hypothetical protein